MICQPVPLVGNAPQGLALSAINRIVGDAPALVGASAVLI
jgi:hypothetical protein